MSTNYICFTLFVAAIGDVVNTTEINGMATEPPSSHVFNVTNYAALAATIKVIAEKVCASTPGKWAQTSNGRL